MKRIIKVLLITIVVLLFVGCEKDVEISMGGKNIVLDTKYEDYYATYYMSSAFMQDNKVENRNDKTFNLYNSDTDLVYRVNILQNSLNVSAESMKDDAYAIENDKTNTVTDGRNEEINKTNWAIVEYKKDTDVFGKDTIIHVYYGLYDYKGTRMYYKIEFISSTENKDFEQAFMNKFKMNH